MKDAEFYSFFQILKKQGGIQVFTLVGSLKKFKVSLERDNECISLSEKEKDHYQEQDVALLQDSKDIYRLKAIP